MFTQFHIWLVILVELSHKSLTSELVFTHIIFRHGDRSPTSTFPTDPYQEQYWPQGWSQLTKLGMEQETELGTWLRNTYCGTFLSENYTRTELFARAANSDRTLQSALSNLAGFFPPTDDQVWNKSSSLAHLWQPIPVHTLPNHEDLLLQPQAIPCPTYNTVFDEQSQSTINDYNTKFASLFNYLVNVTGLQSVDLMSIGSVYDPLYCESCHNLQLPSWTNTKIADDSNATVWDTVKMLKIVAKNIVYNSAEKSKLMSGYLLGDIADRMKNVTSGQGTVASKFVFYSTHDDGIMGLLYAMNVSNGLLIPYAACVIIELYKDDSSNYFVNVKYRNETIDEPYQFTVPGCDNYNCPFETFNSVLQNQMFHSISEREVACDGPSRPSNASNQTFNLCIFFMSILLSFKFGLFQVVI